MGFGTNASEVGRISERRNPKRLVIELNKPREPQPQGLAIGNMFAESLAVSPPCLLLPLPDKVLYWASVAAGLELTEDSGSPSRELVTGLVRGGLIKLPRK